MDEPTLPPTLLPPPDASLFAYGIGVQALLSQLPTDERAEAAAAVRAVIAEQTAERPKVVAMLPPAVRAGIETELQAACAWWEALLVSLDL